MPLYLEKLYHTASLYPVALTQAWQSRSLRVRADCLFKVPPKGWKPKRWQIVPINDMVREKRHQSGLQQTRSFYRLCSENYVHNYGIVYTAYRVGALLGTLITGRI